MTKQLYRIETFTPRSKPEAIALKIDGKPSHIGFYQATEEDAAEESAFKANRWYQCAHGAAGVYTDKSWASLKNAIRAIPEHEIERFAAGEVEPFNWHTTYKEFLAARFPHMA